MENARRHFLRTISGEAALPAIGSVLTTEPRTGLGAASSTDVRGQFPLLSDDGHLLLDRLDPLLSKRTKMVTFPHVSNVLGAINPAKEICERVHRAGAVVLVDAAQSVPHFSVDVREIGCDFLTLSGHKMCSPMGIGALRDASFSMRCHRFRREAIWCMK